MKLSVLFLLLVMPFFIKAQDLQWKKDTLLSWQDFKGKSNENTHIGAATYSRIEFSAHRVRKDTAYHFTFTVRCLFNCDRSWVKSEYKNILVLQHEQLHFDISELYARILYDALTKAVYTADYRIEMHHIYLDIDKARAADQQKYDAQVAHRNTAMQKVWEQHIHDELTRIPSNY